MGLSTGGPSKPSDATGCILMFKDSTNLGTKHTVRVMDSWESSEKRKSQKCNGKEKGKEMGSQIAGH